METLPILPPTNSEGSIPGQGPEGAPGASPQKGEMFLGILQQVMMAAAVQSVPQQSLLAPDGSVPSTGKSAPLAPAFAGSLTASQLQPGHAGPALILSRGFMTTSPPPAGQPAPQTGQTGATPVPTGPLAAPAELEPAVLRPTVRVPMEEAGFPLRETMRVLQEVVPKPEVTAEPAVKPEQSPAQKQAMTTAATENIPLPEKETVVPRPSSPSVPQGTENPVRPDAHTPERGDKNGVIRPVLMPEGLERPFTEGATPEPTQSGPRIVRMEGEPAVSYRPDSPEAVQGRVTPNEPSRAAQHVEPTEQAETVSRQPAVVQASEEPPAEGAVETRSPAMIRQDADAKPLPIEQGVAETPGGHSQQTVFHPAPKVDSSPVRQSPPSVDVTTPALSREIEHSVMDQVVKQVVLQVHGDSSEVRVKLEPPSLGEVLIHVRMENGQLQAQIDVQQAAVKAALDAQIGQLRQSLNERGLDIQRLDVLFNDSSTSRESSGGQDDRQHRGTSPHSSLGDPPEQSSTGRMLGYNTMEIIM